MERGRKYDVDQKILLAKVRNSNYQMKSGVKPLFVDKLGIARISVPDSIKTEDYKIFLEKTGATDKPCGVCTVANPKLLLNGT